MKRSETADSISEEPQTHVAVAEVRRSDTFQTSKEPDTPAHVRVVACMCFENGPQNLVSFTTRVS